MDRRFQLNELLSSLHTEDQVYFQPASNIEMSYPAIVYSRDMADTKFAGNQPYHNTRRYQVTIIDRKPDSALLEKIESLPMCLFQRHFVADGLNHDVYSLYF